MDIDNEECWCGNIDHLNCSVCTEPIHGRSYGWTQLSNKTFADFCSEICSKRWEQKQRYNTASNFPKESDDLNTDWCGKRQR